jgi:hypothetical protein
LIHNSVSTTAKLLELIQSRMPERALLSALKVTFVSKNMVIQMNDLPLVLKPTLPGILSSMQTNPVLSRIVPE